MIIEGANALPFMKATYSSFHCIPLIPLPPEILEMVYMYCTSGRLTKDEVRKLYPAGVLYGMGGVTDREIVHGAVECGLRVNKAGNNWKERLRKRKRETNQEAAMIQKRKK